MAPSFLIRLNTKRETQMDLLKSKTDKELIASVIAELAKASSELRCARADIEKAQGRQRFLMAVLHELAGRDTD